MLTLSYFWHSTTAEVLIAALLQRLPATYYLKIVPAMMATLSPLTTVATQTHVLEHLVRRVLQVSGIASLHVLRLAQQSPEG